MTMKRNSLLKITALALVFVTAVCVFVHIRKSEIADYTDQSGVKIGNSVYRQNNNLTVLFAGIDDLGALSDTPSYRNTSQADFVALVSVNTESGELNLLHLNRDTMVEIDVSDISGDYTGKKITSQLALAHTYGSGGKDSMVNTVRAVSRMIYNIKIDNYVSLNMSGLKKFCDEIGGVGIKFSKDYTEINPDFKKGETVLLNGDAALSFVRARMGVGDETNLSRMERQREFLNAFFKKISQEKVNDTKIKKVFNSLRNTEYSFVTDMSLQKMTNTFNSFKENGKINLYSLKGNADYTKQFTEFYLDKQCLEETAIKLYLKKVR